MALEWSDVDFKRRRLCIQRSHWKGNVTTPKSGRLRYIPLTHRLEGALQKHRRLRSKRVLVSGEGTPLTQREVQGLVRREARRADLRNVGVHVLGHTFCSHLAMRGASTVAIKDLAGHSEIATTQSYMHLSPAASESAIQLLDQGHIRATAPGPAENVSV